MFVDQLVERSLLIPEVRFSNPVISKIYIDRLLSTVLKRRKEIKAEAGNGPFLKTHMKIGFAEQIAHGSASVRYIVQLIAQIIF